MPIELRSRTARAVILPEFGGRLHQLFLSHRGEDRPILDSPHDFAAYATAPTHGGSFPMAPWPNRIASGHFTWDGRDISVPPRRETQRQPRHRARCALARGRSHRPRRELSVELGPRWPWPGTAWQRIELTDTALRLKLEVRAARDAFPAGAGWHPWFRRDAFGATSVHVTLPATERYLSEAQLPTGERVKPSDEFDLRSTAPLGDRRVDTCYRGLTGPVSVDWGAASLEIDIAAPDPHVMLFTPANAFCLEPQTCAPDAFNLHHRLIENTGFAIASPFHPVTIESRWTWTLS